MTSLSFGVYLIGFKGGLGNQMFEYAFYMSLKAKRPLALYCFDTLNSERAHYGYELDKIFYINSGRKRKLGTLMRKLERHNYLHFSKLEEKHYAIYCPEIYRKTFLFTDFEGYWQTEKYFLCIEQRVRQIFLFREYLLSEQTKYMADVIKKTKNSMSLHVRRGDYLEIAPSSTIGREYYDKAVRLLRTQYHGGTLFVFSDDMDWCKANLLYKDTIFVDWNTDDSSWQDMYLMSQCTYNIIANSTFSWWGAWLNNNLNKEVVVPKQWMNDESVETNIIPQSWIRI